MEDAQIAKRAKIDDGSPSEADILRLVAQRESHRQTRRFAESDAIREQLRDLGVELYDKEREWRSKDGRKGILFTAGPDECPFSDEEIRERVQEREESRRAKDWERSNVLRDELRSVGVELSDKESMWRTISGRSGSYSASASPVAIMAGSEIQQLISERERFRSVQDFESADRIRAQLASSGVEIFDAERLWRTTDGRQGVILTGGHEVLCTMGELEINQRVQQREEARSARTWEQADAIREELRRRGVEVIDAQRMWVTTDGRSGGYPAEPQVSVVPAAGQPLSRLQQPATVVAAAPRPARGDTAAAAAQVITSLASLVQQLQPAPARTLAPQPAQQLITAPAIVGAPGPGLTFTDASIWALINGREQARARNDYVAADAIRIDLRNHGIEVWDKEKVWRASDGRSGVVPR